MGRWKYEFSILKRKMPLSLSNSIGFALCPLLKGTLGISIANVFHTLNAIFPYLLLVDHLPHLMQICTFLSSYMSIISMTTSPFHKWHNNLYYLNYDHRYHHLNYDHHFPNKLYYQSWSRETFYVNLFWQPSLRSELERSGFIHCTPGTPVSCKKVSDSSKALIFEHS